MSSAKFLAFDLGASNGRAIAGSFDGDRLSLETIHSFPNGYVNVSGSLHWDALRLFSEIKNGLAVAAAGYGNSVNGIGIDTWGVDHGLLDEKGKLIGNPYCYRDSRTDGLVEEMQEIVGGYEYYRATGEKLAPIYTMTQLYSLVKCASPQLRIADRLLMMPSLLSYFLTGEKLDEHSALSGGGMWNVSADSPATGLLEKFGIPSGLVCDVVRPGSPLGKLRPEIAREAGLTDAQVIAPAGHDTASAVLSVPADEKTRWAFLSSGTWSLLGIESAEPLITETSYQSDIVNAATAEGKFMSRANITGLWIIQECKRIWDRQGQALSWQEIVRLAGSAPAFTAFIDVCDPAFVCPTDMTRAIAEYCKATSQPAPEEIGTMARVIFESLALKYRQTIESIEKITGRRIEVLHIVGGGAQNVLLDQFASSACGIPVVAGPYEATAAGNILMQMVGSGAISSVAEGRQVIRRSFDVQEYLPADVQRWAEAYRKYKDIRRDA